MFFARAPFETPLQCCGFIGPTSAKTVVFFARLYTPPIVGQHWAGGWRGCWCEGLILIFGRFFRKHRTVPTRQRKTSIIIYSRRSPNCIITPESLLSTHQIVTLSAKCPQHCVHLRHSLRFNAELMTNGILRVGTTRETILLAVWVILRMSMKRHIHGITLLNPAFPETIFSRTPVYYNKQACNERNSIF